MLRDFLNVHPISATGIQTAGLPLMLDGKITVIYAKLGCLLSDGDGLRMALQWGGQSCLKLCFRHLSMFKKNSDRVVGSPTYVEFDCHDPNAFKLWNRKDLNMSIDVIVEDRWGSRHWQDGEDSVGRHREGFRL